METLTPQVQADPHSQLSPQEHPSPFMVSVVVWLEWSW
jgi:hypothetical protein